MKESLARIFMLIASAALLTYTGWLFFQGQHVISMPDQAFNMLALVLCFLLALYLFIAMLNPGFLPKSRWTLLWVGIGTIVFAHAYFVDNADSMIYLADIMKLFGVFLCIAGPMKLLISQKTQEQLEEKELEIIEV